jgi:hypothetical protein
MKTLLLAPLLLTTTLCSAQTKMIAHKSHSGSKRSFAKAYQNNLFDLKYFNFGLPGNNNLVVLDTVVALPNGITLLKMRVSRVCYRYGTSYRELESADFESYTDTLRNNDLFNPKNAVATIKASKTFPVTFANPVQEVVFIGFKK